MEKYIKPACKLVNVDMENSLLAASPTLNDTEGDGKWNAPHKRYYFDEEEEDF